MNRKHIRTTVLLFSGGLLIFVCISKGVANYFGFLILSALILQGIKAIVDFLLGLPMCVGYSKILEKNEHNEFGRLILLFLGIAMIIFACWWIAVKPI